MHDPETRYARSKDGHVGFVTGASLTIDGGFTA
jgi:hypothetical protein